jgi:hypothetical protein
MNSIEEELKPLSGYLVSIKRNTVKGWYELEVGVPADWIYKSNEQINCDVKKKGEKGHLLTISPKNENIIIDDLVAFVKLIIDTNNRIREKEKEFTSKMNKVKKDLENQAKEFYEELDELKEKSFSKFDTKKESNNDTKQNNNKEENINKEEEKDNSSKKVETKTTTKKRGRPPKTNSK